MVVEDWQPEWARRFDRIQGHLLPALAGVTARVEHVGSTSVPGLAAKPIIDVDIVIPSEAQLAAAIEALAALGYTHEGEKGIAGRHAFEYSGRPDDSGGRRNLYVCIEGAESLRNHLLLRDHLRSHPEAVAEYAALKKQLALRFPDDIDGYVEGKTELILRLLAAEGFGQETLDEIAQANQRPEPKPEPEPEPEPQPEPEPEPEPELAEEPASEYADSCQVAGHPNSMRFEGDLVLKKMQGAGKHDSGRSRGLSRGEKEAQFLLETAPAHGWLRDRVPAAQGVRTMPDGSRWLVMESLTAGLRR